MKVEAQENEFLRPDEVSALLRCGRTKVYAMLQAGQIPSYRVGKSRIVRRADVLAWLEGNREGQHPDPMGFTR